jgi:MFS family permease
MVAEEMGSTLSFHSSEATSLLYENGSVQTTHYGSVIRHTSDVNSDSLATEAYWEIASPILTQVKSAQPSLDIGSNLESLASARSVKHGDGSINETHATSVKEGDYASRFINISPMRFWSIFSGVMLGYMIGFFDSTLMASSHPVITSYFHAANTASWLSTAFLLTSTAFLPLFGRMSDALGRKPVYLFSIFMFLLSTLWCGQAQSISSFIAARALCGIGAGGVFSMGQILSSELVRLEYRGVYQSYLNLCIGIGSCMGLAFGGFLCEQIGWRGIFYVQLPFIFAYFIAAVFTVPADLGLKTVDAERLAILQLIRGIDLTGSLILVLAVTALIMGLNLGGNVFRWTHPLVVCSLVTALVLAVVLVRYERNVPRAVLPVKLLSENPRASLIIGDFFGSISINTMVFNAPLYFHAVKLDSPSDSGLHLLGASIAVTASSVVTGCLITSSKRLKPTIIIGGFCMLMGGCVASLLAVTTPSGFAMICVSFSSLGQGFASPSLTMSILATSGQDDQAIASTTLGLARNLGSVMGVAISSWIFQNTLLYQLQHKVTGLDKDHVIGQVRKSIHAIADLDPFHQKQGSRSLTTLREVIPC